MSMKPDALPASASVQSAVGKPVLARTQTVHMDGQAGLTDGLPSPKSLVSASTLAGGSVVHWSERALAHALQHGAGNLVLPADAPVPTSISSTGQDAATHTGESTGLAEHLRPQKAPAQASIPLGGDVVRWSGRDLAHVLQPGVGSRSPVGARLAWPSSGLGAAQVHGQAIQLLQALPVVLPGLKGPVVLLAAQMWSPGFLAQWLAGRAAVATSLPSLQAWASRQMQVQTPAGQQHLSMRLWVAGEPGGGPPEPGPTSAASATFASRVVATPPASPANLASPAGPAGVVRWPVSPWLDAGALAGVLQTEGGLVFNALLVLEWGPRREQVVYGKELAQTRHDPWLLHGQWLVQGPKERQPPSAADEPPCNTPGCPYRGQAVCPQPFCPATGTVAAVPTVTGV